MAGRRDVVSARGLYLVRLCDCEECGDADKSDRRGLGGQNERAQIVAAALLLIERIRCGFYLSVSEFCVRLFNV